MISKCCENHSHLEFIRTQRFPFYPQFSKTIFKGIKLNLKLSFQKMYLLFFGHNVTITAFSLNSLLEETAVPFNLSSKYVAKFLKYTPIKAQFTSCKSTQVCNVSKTMRDQSLRNPLAIKKIPKKVAVSPDVQRLQNY